MLRKKIKDRQVFEIKFVNDYNKGRAGFFLVLPLFVLGSVYCLFPQNQESPIRVLTK